MRYFFLVLWCSIAALLTATLVGEDLTLSLRVWLAAFVTWFAGALLLGALSRANLWPSRVQLLAVTASEESETSRALHDFRSLESLLLRSRTNERTHHQQLRPRLAALADHFLLVHHGINRRTQPERAAAVLGQVAWLIDDDATTPAPTFDDVDEFLDLILPGGPGDRRPRHVPGLSSSAVTGASPSYLSADAPTTETNPERSV